MLLPLLLALQLPLAGRADPDSIRGVHHPLHHDLTIVVGDTGQHIVAVAATTWLLGSADPLEVELDSVFRVVRVLADGRGESRMGRITFAILQGGGVFIPHNKAAGDTLHTSIRYHGVPRDGLVIRTDSTGRRTIFADNWPDRAHGWIPLIDHPHDKASVTLHLEVPAGMQVVANGTLQKIDTLVRGRTIWTFDQPQPIPPYGIVFGAGRLATTVLSPAACAVRCVPLSVVTFPEDSAWAVDGPFHRAGDMLDFYSGLIGPFPYDLLSHVESTTIFGGAENPTAIFYDHKAYASHRLGEQTVAHETAHQWFGDAVTEDDWHHLWLSEGFATYYAALWVRHADGDSAFRAVMQKNAERVFGSEATNQPIIDLAATDLMGLLNSNNYPKGAWVLHSLRGLIGDSAYNRGIRDWYQRYRDSTALSSDLSRVMGQAAGQDLDWYFTQMLTQPGYPRLQVQWKREGKTLVLTLRQLQPAAWGLYRMPHLGVRVDGRMNYADVAGAETVVRLDDVRKDPMEIVVDPEGWWLLQATVVRQ